MHFIRKLLNLVSFRRPRANSVEPTEFRETSAGRICCSLECRYPAVSHPFPFPSFFLAPTGNSPFSVLKILEIRGYFYFQAISPFSLFLRGSLSRPTPSIRVFNRDEWNKGFRFCCAVQRNEQRQPLFNVERVRALPKKRRLSEVINNASYPCHLHR